MTAFRIRDKKLVSLYFEKLRWTVYTLPKALWNGSGTHLKQKKIVSGCKLYFYKFSLIFTILMFDISKLDSFTFDSFKFATFKFAPFSLASLNSLHSKFASL